GERGPSRSRRPRAGAKAPAEIVPGATTLAARGPGAKVPAAKDPGVRALAGKDLGAKDPAATAPAATGPDRPERRRPSPAARARQTQSSVPRRWSSRPSLGRRADAN